MSKMSKHSRGPWHVGPIDDTLVSFTAANGQRHEIAQALGNYDNAENWPIMEANARLLAAAPELLEAAQSALNYIENTESELGISLRSGDMLRAAIAKAVQP